MSEIEGRNILIVDDEEGNTGNKRIF